MRSDKEILDWLEQRDFDLYYEKTTVYKFRITWFTKGNDLHSVSNISVRDCVNKAIDYELRYLNDSSRTSD